MHWGLAKTPTALMRSDLVVVDQPGIEIGLQLVDRMIDLLAERDPIELVEHGAVKALADSIRLWALWTCAGKVESSL